MSYPMGALVNFFLHCENLIDLQYFILQTWLRLTLKNHTTENTVGEIYVLQDIAVIEDTTHLYHYSDFPKTKKGNS